MKRLTIVVLLVATPFALSAQNSGSAFQYVFTSSGEGTMKTVTLVKPDGKVVTGKPLSATEERHTVQILGDGTHLESKSTDKFYRDNQGRTRTEREDGTVLINDPVSGATAEINASTKAVRRTTGYAYTTSDSGPITEKLKAELAAGSYTITTGASVVADKVKAEAAARASKNEDLGFQMVNGTSAQGTRNTTTIPQGQIGNDRDINIVNERWFAPDLQMLVKSVNKDPRFGETTYELTNISQAVPDASLFEMPASSHQK